MEKLVPAYQGEYPYIFVCYSHEDAKSVLPEIKRLHELGYNIWYDEGIGLGHEWTAEIAHAISGATEFLYFVSASSVDSRNCRNELQFAATRSKPIIAVHIEPTSLPGGVELAIGLSQAIRRYDVTDEEFIRKLATVLTAPGPINLSKTDAKENRNRNLKWIASVFAASVLIALLVAGWRIQNQDAASEYGQRETPAGLDAPSIAVLPFDNLSSDPEQRFFSDGVAEEVLNLLANNSSIKVISRSSSFSFSDQKMTLPEIAEKLGVNHILQGSVRKSGDIVRIAVQLVEVQSDSYVWSKSYDREFKHIFSIQEEIAEEIFAALNVVFVGKIVRATPTNAEAYSLYLRARHTLGIGATVQDLKLAESQLKRALEMEPDYVAAWRELGRVYLQQVGAGIISGEESTRLRWEMVSNALKIDPDDPVSNAYRGFQEMVVNDDLEEGARRFEKAILLAPNHEDVLRPLIMFMLYLDRVEEALPFAELAVQRDPLCGFCLTNLGHIYQMLGRLDEAERVFLAAATVLKDSSGPTLARAEIELLRGNPQSALSLLAQLPDSDARRHAGTTVAQHELGLDSDVQASLTYLSSTWPDEYGLIASTYAAIGDPETAFGWLERGMASDAGSKLQIGGMPRPSAWIPYQDDQRWQHYLKAIGRSPERLRAIKFNPKPPSPMRSSNPGRRSTVL